MRNVRFETTLSGAELTLVERHMKAAGMRSRAAFVRLCLTSGPATQDIKMERCLADIGLLCAVLQAAAAEGGISSAQLDPKLDDLARHFRDLIRLLRKRH